VLKLALVGAPYTGKSALAAALDEALKTSDCAASASVVIVPTPLPAASLAGYDVVLLMGLETPVRGPDMGDLPALTTQRNEVREAADQSIRSALLQAGVPYQVIYGSVEERLAHALAALEPLLKTAGQRLRHSPGALDGPDSAGKTRPWVWVCDKCSDPQCEHRLLSDLLAGRARPV
jgi:nicotinamide riboside kinase